MGAATLTVRPVDGQERETRQVELECGHGLTRALYANSADGFELNDEAVTRYVLLRHHQEQHCRCVRKIWRQAFRAPWPTVPYTTNNIGSN